MYTPTTREKKLEALLDASKILNTSQDSDEILKSLLELSLDLIEGGDAGCIFLYNPTSKLLEMFAYVGMGDAVKQARLKPGESMTGLCFINNTPMFFDGGDVVQQTMGTMTQENVDIAMQGNVRADKIYGSICCPLLHHEESLGVLVIDNFSNQAPLTESDVEVLTAISVQATIAIINARNYEKELANNRKLEEYNRIIENQRDLYQLSTQVHSRFVDMVLKGSTIDDIIQDVKQLTGKDILIIDFVHNITSHTFGATLPAEIEKNSAPFVQASVSPLQAFFLQRFHAAILFHFSDCRQSRTVELTLSDQRSKPTLRKQRHRRRKKCHHYRPGASQTKRTQRFGTIHQRRFSRRPHQRRKSLLCHKIFRKLQF